jgi:hypothetical protein
MHDIIIMDDPERPLPRGRTPEDKVNMWCDSDSTEPPRIILTFEGQQWSRDALAERVPELVVKEGSKKSVFPQLIIEPPKDSLMTRAALLVIMAKLAKLERWNLRFHES